MAQTQPNPPPTQARPTSTQLPPKPPPPFLNNRQCDCLNRCGDDPWLKDGRVDKCNDLIRIEQEAAERALWRLCRWKDVNQELPDADETVLVATIDNTEPVWLGYYDGERWLDAEGIPVNVSHWAPMPEAPKC